MAYSTRLHNRIIHSEKGLATYVISIVGLLIAMGGLWMLIDAYVLGRRELDVITSLSLLFCLGFLWFIPRLLATHIAVSEESLSIKQFAKEQRVDWSEVEKIVAVTTYFGGFSLGVTKVGATRNIVIPASMFANGNYFVKAIFEAASKANPRIELVGGLFLSSYGPPPYGIFTTQPPERSP
jgi:hypothetical protein